MLIDLLVVVDLIIVYVEMFCECEDYFWDVICQLLIFVDNFEDVCDQNCVMFGIDEMFCMFLFKGIWGILQNELV